MKLKIISGILTLSTLLALAFISSSCNKSSKEKTESTDKGTTTKVDSENAVFDSQQQIAMLLVDTVIAEKPGLGKEKVVEKMVKKRYQTPRSAKRTSTTKNDDKPSKDNKTISMQVTNEPVKTAPPDETRTSKAKANYERSRNEPESPTKVVPEKEQPHPLKTETDKAKTTVEKAKSELESTTEVVPEKEKAKVATQPEPKPEEGKPNENIVTKSAKEENKGVESGADEGTVPAKENNRETEKGNGWQAPASAKKLENPVPVNKSTLASAKKSYARECLSCHGKKGKGDGPNALGSEKKVPNLLKQKVLEQTDGELYWKITNGRKPMPAAKKALTDEQRWGVVNCMRNLQAKYGKKNK